MPGKSKGTTFVVQGSGNNVATTGDGKVTINGQEYDTPTTVTDDNGNTVTVKQN